jgi:hypothetical protein
MARACKRLIVSTEKLVDTSEIRSAPDRTIIPYYLVDAVVHAPFASHPGEMVACYERDEEHIKAYFEATKDATQVKAYLDKWVYGVKDHKGYLELVGKETLNKLKL